MAFIVVNADRTTSIGTASGDVVIVKNDVVVTSPLDGINAFNSSDLVILNNGVVAGDLIGASVSSGSVVTNSKTGMFYGSAVGVWLNGSQASLSNAGFIQSRGDGLADITAAVGLNNASGALVENSGTIIGGNIGIDLHGSTNNTTITNTGQITSINATITGGGTLNLTSSGTISSSAGTAIDFFGSDDRIKVVNTGTIHGNDFAVGGSSVADILSNAGTIDGNVGLGLGADRVVNTGKIFGDLDLGDGNDVYNASGAGFVLGSILAGAGNDTVRAGNFADTIDGGAGADFILGRAGDDILTGGDDNDTLDGGVGDDTLEGGSGEDILYGRAGDDILIGGTGNDILTGGGGADIFVFADGFGADTITDFIPRRTDKIDLSDVSSIVDFSDLVANHLTQVGDNAVIDAGGGDTIVLENVIATRLIVSDFIFA